MEERIDQYLKNTIAALNLLDRNEINSALLLLRDTLNLSGKTYIAGNGGNFANALHYGVDWGKGLQQLIGKNLNPVVLGENISTFSAFSNDDSFENVYVNLLRLQNFQTDKDVLVILSAGGSSTNMIKLAKYANSSKLKSIALCGFDNKHLKPYVDSIVFSPVSDMQLVEDAHAIFCHLVMRVLSSEIKLEKDLCFNFNL
jgi:D-sedoheptulose 7-phosphate isomerase